MNDELILQEGFESEITVEQGSIKFDSSRLKQEAKQIADYLSNIEVTDSTVKENKKLVAKLSKATKILEDERIRIKNQMLEPYAYFEKEVKEIVGIVKGADDLVRSQIRDLEELERDRKRDELMTIWNMRVEHYTFRDIVKFDQFIRPQHLNKTTPISKTELEMVEYMESIDKDLKALRFLEDSEDILEVYLEHFDLSRAIQTVQRRKETKERVAEFQKRMTPAQKDVVEDSFLFKIVGKKDRKLVEMLLKENDIEFEVIEELE